MIVLDIAIVNKIYVTATFGWHYSKTEIFMQKYIFLHLFVFLIMLCPYNINDNLNSALISLWTQFGHKKLPLAIQVLAGTQLALYLKAPIEPEWTTISK